MSKVKQDIMRAALERIANDESLLAVDPVRVIAQKALADVAAVVEYRITARVWWGRNGAESKAELRSVETGNVLIEASAFSSAWQYPMRDQMIASGLFPSPGDANPMPTVYFRDVCSVDYDEREVARKRDL